MPRSFRALSYVKTYSTNTLVMAGSESVAMTPLAVGSFPRQLKNIRGDLQFTTGDSSPTSADAAQGWVALIRWPALEVLNVSEVKLDDPRTLHPVVWQFRTYPGHIRYEFKGINLAGTDSLYLVVHKGYHSGNDNVYCDFVLLWAQLNHPATV